MTQAIDKKIELIPSKELEERYHKASEKDIVQSALDYNMDRAGNVRLFMYLYIKK